MIIDTHAHYDDEAFDTDREALLTSMYDGGIEKIVNVCASVGGFQDTVDLMEKYPFIYGAVGIHPDDADKMTQETLDEIRRLSHMDKMVAIGEIGLDYYYLYTDKETQKYWFARQIELAKELDLPILIHDRDAHGDTLSILKAHQGGNLRGILHCFSGSLETAKELMKLGFYISFAGPVVFPKSLKLKEVAKEIPMDRLLIETDSPYLTPPPFRGKRNDPSNVRFVAEEIARLKGVAAEEIAEQTKRNAMEVYGIGK